VNYVDEDTAFERWCENNYLPIESQAIWKKLFKRFNRSGWSEWVTVDNLTLMADVQIRHEKTFIGYRDKLLEAGLIKYEKGKKGSPNKYKLISYEIYYPELYTVKNTSKNEVHSTVEREVYPPVQMTVEPTDITKRNKTKQNEESERGGAPAHTDSEKHRYGEYGWVLLTDAEYERLVKEYGEEKTAYYIAYVDESAQTTKNKHRYKDWNLVIRKAIRGNWGAYAEVDSQPRNAEIYAGYRNLAEIEEVD